MEHYTQAFPIEAVCSPEATSSFTDCGFHEVERNDSGRAVRLQKPEGCELDLDHILVLARSGVTLLVDSAGDWIIDAKLFAAKSGVVAELDPDMIGRPMRTDVSFTGRTVDPMVALYWHVRLHVERDLGLFPNIGRCGCVRPLPLAHKSIRLIAIGGRTL
jgi:hypothetical protein